MRALRNAAALLGLLLAAAGSASALTLEVSEIPGAAAGANLGKAVAGPGDLDGDLAPDTALGAPFENRGSTANGAVRVRLGRSLAPGPILAGGAAHDHFGISLANASDVDGDGLGDLVVGARFSDLGAADGGAVFTFRGGAAFPAGAPVIAVGEAADDWFGQSVASAGDVNGDGFGDLVVGAPYNDANGTAAGRAYVFLGGRPFDGTPDLVLQGDAQAHSHFGWSVGGGVDFNGDGRDDVIVGARLYGSGPNRARGRAYVFFGGAPMDATWDLVLDGEAANDWFGQAVAGIGDVNGDGFGDLAVGAIYADPPAGSAAGKAYVYLGGSPPDALADLVIPGPDADAQLGNALAAAGDVDGDGFADALVGAHFADVPGAPSAGRVFLLRGAPTPAAMVLEPIDGRAADDHFGEAVAPANALVVGAEQEDQGGFNAGKAYVFRPAAASCGDLDANGLIDARDVARFRAYLSGASALPAGGEQRCALIGPTHPCDLRDVAVLRRAIEGPALPPGIAAACAEAALSGAVRDSGLRDAWAGGAWLALLAVLLLIPLRRGRALLCLAALLPAPAAALDAIEVRARDPGSALRVDGQLAEAEWARAVPFAEFYETDPGDRGAPPVTTRVYLLRDAEYLYVGIDALDPEPGRIAASHSAEDRIPDTDDQIAVFIDATHDDSSAMLFYVNPVGARADGIWDDATYRQDLAVDLFHDSAARIHARGWSAELRIPFSSLRYATRDPGDWKILVWRSYPRTLRHELHSSPIPRGSNCRICHGRPLVGLADLPRQSHWVAVPYALLGSEERVERPLEPRARRERRDSEREIGLDLKWQPVPDHAFDLTLNPDFSLVEADVPQVADNERFALFFPELRPFFLEGSNLFGTPLQAVHTRSITSPRWGTRATGRIGATAFSVLSVEDRGGGSAIVPGALSSTLARQDYRSWVNVARLRREFDGSFAGLLVTDREIRGESLGHSPLDGSELRNGGYNRVIGPDFHWRIGEQDVIAGQLLLSRSQTPRRPDLTPDWTGESRSGGAGFLSWSHVEEGPEWLLEYRDVAEGFRADVGFVPQVGLREGHGQLGYSFHPSSPWVTRVKPLVSYRDAYDRDGERIGRIAAPALELRGVWNGMARAELNSAELRLYDPLLEREKSVSRTNLFLLLQLDPGRWLPRVQLNASLGPEFDYANARVGDGRRVSLSAALQPTRRLGLELIASRESLEVDERGAEGRLFTSDIWRAKATYMLSSNLWMRLIVQQTETDRDPRLYLRPESVSSRDGGLEGSLILSYRLNWRTSIDLGYTDQRITSLDTRATPVIDQRLQPAERRFFVKLSHAFQR